MLRAIRARTTRFRRTSHRAASSASSGAEACPPHRDREPYWCCRHPQPEPIAFAESPFGHLAVGEDRLARTCLELQEPLRGQPDVPPDDLLAIMPDFHPVAAAMHGGLLPGGDLDFPARGRELGIQPVEHGLEQRSQREGATGFFLESRRARNTETLRGTENVQSDTDGDIGVLPLCARLGQDAPDLSPADVQVIGPFELDLHAARVSDRLAQPARDGDRHQRDRLPRPSLPDEREIEAAAAGSLPPALAPTRARLRLGDQNGRRKALFLVEVHVDELLGEVVGGFHHGEERHVLERPPPTGFELSPRERDHAPPADSAERRPSSSTRRFRVFSTTAGGALSKNAVFCSLAESSVISPSRAASVRPIRSPSAPAAVRGTERPIERPAVTSLAISRAGAPKVRSDSLARCRSSGASGVISLTRLRSGESG